jgi:hypothetical protein
MQEQFSYMSMDGRYIENAGAIFLYVHGWTVYRKCRSTILYVHGWTVFRKEPRMAVRLLLFYRPKLSLTLSLKHSFVRINRSFSITHGGFGFETRRKYIPVGLTVASMLPTVSKPKPPWVIEKLQLI